MDPLSTVAVVGSPFSERFSLTTKLLKNGYKVKGADGEFMYGGMYIEMERLYFESCDKGYVDQKRMLSDIISGCDAVVCVGFFSENARADKSTDYGHFASFVDASKSCGVRRFICVPCLGTLQEDKGVQGSGKPTFDWLKQSSESISLYEEYLHEVVADEFTAITVRSDPDGACSRQKKLELTLSVIHNHTIKTRRVTVIGRKGDCNPTSSDFADRWYEANPDDISHVAIESMHDLCVYLLEDATKEICGNVWPYLVAWQSYINRFPVLNRLIRLKERPYFPIVLNIRRSIARARWVTRRLLDVFMMMMLFHLWPEQTYRFSTRKLLPSIKNRWPKDSRQVIPYDLLKSKSSKIQEMEEINVIGRGSSFDIGKLESINGPKFLVSFWAPAKTDDNNVTYVIGRKRVVDLLTRMGLNVISDEVYGTDKDGKLFPHSSDWGTTSFLNLFKNDRCKRISVAEKVYRPPLLAPYLKWTPTGSFLPVLCALSFFAERINVYGWDFYLESSPEDMSYWQLFFNMYKYKPDVNRSRNHFESAMLNFYYGYHLSKLPNIKVHGYLGKLERHAKLIRRIERVLFNP